MKQSTRYVTGKQKSSKKLDLLNHSGTYYVINDCDVRKGVLVANLTVKKKRSFFIKSQANKLHQLYIYENHYYKTNFLVRDTHVDNFQVVRPTSS